MFEDVMRAIQHVRNNADMYDIDPNKIAIWGDSSGGSLAMRANATGKSGAKVAVGWSPPTNAYTGLFRSYKSLLIGMDHSTCAPTDIAGAANFTDLLNGGSGDIAQYDGSLANWGLGSVGEIGQNNGSFQPLDLLTQVLTAGQYAAQTSQNIESISSQLESGGIAGMSGGVINLASKKLVECLDNFNALSPALFASPDSSPAFLAGFETDDVVGPEQVYEMRDKLRSLGIRSEAMVLQGDPDAGAGPFSPTKNHLGYDPRFVCDTLNFVDEIIQTGKHVDCANGTATDASDEGGEGAGGGGSEGGSPGGGGPSGGQEPSESSCAAEGKVFRGKGQSPDNPSVFRGAGCQTQSVYLREECITNGGTYTPGDREGDIGSCAPKKENCLDKVFPTCKGKTYTLKGKGCPKGTQPVMTGPSGKRYVICQ